MIRRFMLVGPDPDAGPYAEGVVMTGGTVSIEIQGGFSYTISGFGVDQLQAVAEAHDSTVQWIDPDGGVSFEDMGNMGVVQEVNRQLLHPVGLALARLPDGGLTIIEDPDPEGWRYEGFDLQPAAEAFEARQVVWHTRRYAALGYVRQPVSPDHTCDVAGCEETFPDLDSVIAHERTHDTRTATCVERWPECWDGGYDPRCCRFPKSCSCDDLSRARDTSDDG